MNKPQAIRKAIAATILSTALALSAVGAASADGGVNTETLEVAHVGLKSPLSIYEVTDVTMKRGVVEQAGATKYNDIMLKPPVVEMPLSAPLPQSRDPIARYHLTDAWPQK